MNSKTHPTGVHAQTPSTSNNTQSHHDSVKLRQELLLPAHSLKRKKTLSSAIVPGPSSLGPKGRNSETQRAENRAPVTSKTAQAVSSASRQSPTRAFAAMGRPPSLGPDSLVCAPSKKDKGMVEESASAKRPRDIRGRHNDVDEADRQCNISVDKHKFTGPQEMAEYESMKKEIEILKEALHESKKTCVRQAKQLEESRNEAKAAVNAMKGREVALVDARTKSRQNEELLSTIESFVQCQICMDPPDKPFALNPCGHVLCLSCLQEWFRKALPALDDMDMDPDELTDPQYVLTRSKTCPLCRAVVKHRPVPIFMIKSVVAVLKKTKLPHASSGNRHNNDYLHPGENPWKGIFASSEEEAEEAADEDNYSEVESDGLEWYRHSVAVEDNAATESEMENEEDDQDDDGNLYTQQHWAPPTVSITDYDVGVKLLQRGCSRDMLQNFDVSYSHGSGIVVILRSLDHLYASDGDDGEDADYITRYRVFLGWNIALEPDDTDGEDYMEEMLREVREVPERWQVTPTPGVPSSMDARRLVDVDEAEEFDTTDTEAWIDNEDL